MGQEVGPLRVFEVFLPFDDKIYFFYTLYLAKKGDRNPLSIPALLRLSPRLDIRPPVQILVGHGRGVGFDSDRRAPQIGLKEES